MSFLTTPSCVSRFVVGRSRVPPLWYRSPSQVYAGHDYALNFLPNTASRDSRNPYVAEQLAWAQACRAAGRPAAPSTMLREKRTNLYMRVVSDTAKVAELYPEWDQSEGNLAKLLDQVYNTI